MIILRPKNVIFERFWPLSKFYFPAYRTLHIMHEFATVNYGDLFATQIPSEIVTLSNSVGKYNN